MTGVPIRSAPALCIPSAFTGPTQAHAQNFAIWSPTASLYLQSNERFSVLPVIHRLILEDKREKSLKGKKKETHMGFTQYSMFCVFFFRRKKMEHFLIFSFSF